MISCQTPRCACRLTCIRLPNAGSKPDKSCNLTPLSFSSENRPKQFYAREFPTGDLVLPTEVREQTPLPNSPPSSKDCAYLADVSTVRPRRSFLSTTRRHANRPREFDGQKAALGSWMVGQESVAVGIRESAGPIAINRSRFIPHRPLRD